MEKQMQHFEVELSLQFPCSPARMWDAITKNIHQWWDDELYTSPKTKRFVVEPFLGGKMYEDAGDGAGVVWAEVIAVNPEKELLFKGHLAPSFGGPATSYMSFKLAGHEDTCHFTLNDQVFGFVNPGMEKSLEEGWEMIFNQKLRKYLET